MSTPIERRKSIMHGRTHYMVCGREGTIDFHVSPGFDGELMGGVEFHHREPPDYMDQAKPSHAECWAIMDKGPCWHDGTSLWADEYWIPLLNDCGEDAVFRNLEKTYAERMPELKTDLQNNCKTHPNDLPSLSSK